MPRSRRDVALVSRVAATLRRFALFPRGARVLCAVSGGADSLVMCEVLRLVARRFPLELVVGHVDHGLRADSAADCERARAFAIARGLAFVSRRVDVARGASVEARARELRHRALRELAAEVGASHIALGHTASDRAETLLLFLARGAGPKGLSSMSPRSEQAGFVLVRPLIELTRAEVRAFAQAAELVFLDDPTNDDLSLSRNLLRAEVLPRLEALYPGLDRRLAELSDQLAAEDAFLDAEVERRLGAVLEPGVVPAGSIAALPDVLQTRALRRCLAAVRGDTRGLTRAHLELVRGLLRPGAREVLVPGCKVTRDGAVLRFVPWSAGEPRSRTVPEPLSPIRLLGPGAYSPRPGINFEVHLLQLGGTGARGAGVSSPRASVSPQRAAASFDASTLQRPLWLRGPLPGDRIRLEGGGRQKIFDLFTNARIPRSLRAGWPVLADDEEVLWVPGLRQSARGRPRSAAAPAVHIVAHGLLLAGAYANEVETCAVVSARDRKGEP